LLSDVDGIVDADSKVTLMTLHSAKGLEFDHVFIIAVEQEVLPHIRSLYDPSQLEEERRLFFVGITRARNRLQLSTARTRGFNNSKMSSPSSFLFELPRAEMEIVDKSDSYGFGDEFSSEDHGGSFEEEWEAKSFLHQGKKNKTTVPKRIKADLPNPRSTSQAEEWEDSQEMQNPSDPDDVVFQDFSETQDISPDDDAPQGLDAISKKLARLSRQLPGEGLKTAAQVAAATTMNGVPVDRFQEGSLVNHATYGQGTIRSVEGKGLRRMARIVFADGESKSFQLSKSKLELQ
jgi:DNA helicase-2/ATP-dependent DNA helicase PcrA